MSTATGLGAGQSEVRIRVGERHFLFSKHPGKPSLQFDESSTVFPGVERSERGTKNDWFYTTSPRMCLHGLDRESFFLFELFSVRVKWERLGKI